MQVHAGFIYDTSVTDSKSQSTIQKHCLYFYTYNKMLSWEVMYLSSFQSYYSSANFIQFFSYFISSNGWTVYII
jgi:hypothetical protein